MEKNARLAFRILANLYPDKKPSEIKKIINDALKKEERPEDMELWMILTKDVEEEKEDPPVEKKVIEEHHYYHHYDSNGWTINGPTYYTVDKNINPCTITCSNNDEVIDLGWSPVLK